MTYTYQIAGTICVFTFIFSLFECIHKSVHLLILRQSVSFGFFLMAASPGHAHKIFNQCKAHLWTVFVKFLHLGLLSWCHLHYFFLHLHIHAQVSNDSLWRMSVSKSPQFANFLNISADASTAGFWVVLILTQDFVLVFWARFCVYYSLWVQS